MGLAGWFAHPLLMVIQLPLFLFYYLSVGGLFTALRVPLTHDAVRAIAAVFWLLCAIASASLVFRLTASRIAENLPGVLCSRVTARDCRVAYGPEGERAVLPQVQTIIARARRLVEE